MICIFQHSLKVCVQIRLFVFVVLMAYSPIIALLKKQEHGNNLIVCCGGVENERLGFDVHCNTFIYNCYLSCRVVQKKN